jgi:hypothetical protein
MASHGPALRADKHTYDVASGEWARTRVMCRVSPRQGRGRPASCTLILITFTITLTRC